MPTRLLLSLMLVLGGCGQKGPLFLPANPAPAAASAPSAEAASAPEAPPPASGPAAQPE
ncbi:MAG: LPS translocon maturation chaperone LptM [Pseudomonadota bacterium]